MFTDRKESIRYALHLMPAPLPQLTSGAQALLMSIHRRARALGLERACDAHALAAVLECPEAGAHSLLLVDPVLLLPRVYGELAEGQGGGELDLEDLAGFARQFAAAMEAPECTERHVAMAVLTMAGLPASRTLLQAQQRVMAIERPCLDQEGLPEWVEAVPCGRPGGGRGDASGDDEGGPFHEREDDNTPKERSTGGFADGFDESPAGEESGGSAGSGGAVAAVPGGAAAWNPEPIDAKLLSFGRDLTAEAAAGLLPPFVGREPELRQVIETLCRPGKSNPVLIGPAGVGKTAIVVGLAQRMVAGDVPKHLRDRRILEVRVPHVIAGGKWVGTIEQRVKHLLIAASRSRLILFIDELHMIIGAGTSVSDPTDVADMFKPGLADGSIVLIGATTEDEYRQHIESDAAFERRLQPVRVGELTRRESLEVLGRRAESYTEERALAVADDVLEWLVSFADRSMRNRFLPDKAVDLLDQCVGRASVAGLDTLTIECAQEVAYRAVGAPDGVQGRVARLDEALCAVPILPTDDRLELLQTLRVTMGGYDVRPVRANACLLLIGEVAEFARTLAKVVAKALFGSPDRVVSHDLLAGGTDPDVALAHLLGPPPGTTAATHIRGTVLELTAMPWTVLLLERVDRVDPLARVRIADALASGYFVDGGGKRRYLSDAVVILTAPDMTTTMRNIGFAPGQTPGRGPHPVASLAKRLGDDLVKRSQVVWETGPLHDVAVAWLSSQLLPQLAERYDVEGMALTWTDGLVESLADRLDAAPSWEAWESNVEDVLCTAIVDAIVTGDGRAASHTAYLEVSGTGVVARVGVCG